MDYLDDDIWRRQVRNAIKTNDHRKLVQCVANVDMSQQPAFFLVQLANELFYEKHQEAAEEILRRTQLSHPADFWANQNLAVLLADKTPPQWDEAVRFFTTSVSLQKSAGALLNLGSTLIDAKRYKEAEATLKEAVALQPKYSHAYCFLAQAQIKLEKFEAARKNLETASTIRKDIHHWHYTYGMYYFEQDEFSKAMPFYAEAVKLRPNINRQIIKNSRLLFQREKIAEALSYMELANELNPSNPHTLYHYAVMNHNLENFVEAERLYRKIIQLDPHYAEAMCNLGHILSKRGEHASALTWLRKGHRMGSRKRGWRYPSGKWVTESEKKVREQNRASENSLELNSLQSE